jgi:DNA-binding transcriptional ArsR family regulator
MRAFRAVSAHARDRYETHEYHVVMATDRADFNRQVHRALAHPLRVRILELATERDEVSPVDLAEEMQESLGVVSYHVRALAAAGLLELSGRSFRRGAVKHHYRAVPQLGVTVRVAVSARRAKELTQQIQAAIMEAAEDDGGDTALTVVIHHGDGTDPG